MERTIDLFEVERRKERKERFFRLMMMSVVAMLVVATTGFGETAFDTAITTKITGLFENVIPLVQKMAIGILLILFVKKLFDAVGGNGGPNVWWEILGIAIVAGLIGAAPAVFKAITGQSI